MEAKWPKYTSSILLSPPVSLGRDELAAGKDGPMMAGADNNVSVTAGVDEDGLVTGGAVKAEETLHHGRYEE